MLTLAATSSPAMLKLVAVRSIARSRTTNATRAAVRSFTVAPSPNFRANTIAASAPIQTSHASRRAQIPIGCTAPSAHDRSRFRALALFGRRPIERVAAIVFTGIQKPAQKQKLSCLCE
jgi:hypothetical protein